MSTHEKLYLLSIDYVTFILIIYYITKLLLFNLNYTYTKIIIICTYTQK